MRRQRDDRHGHRAPRAEGGGARARARARRIGPLGASLAFVVIASAATALDRTGSVAMPEQPPAAVPLSGGVGGGPSSPAAGSRARLRWVQPLRRRAPRAAPAGALSQRAREATVPSAAALERARRWAGRRQGAVSFAVVDSKGTLHGLAARRPYPAASVVKAMLLAAEVERLERERLPLDPATASLLHSMITWSDNDAATAIYARSGDAGLARIARRAGMRRFWVGGHWGNARVTAADVGRYFARLDAVLAGPHRRFALRLLGSVVDEQSWGIPAAAGDSWAVHFKGGWRETDLGQLAHQGARLRERGGDRSLAIAVLTDGQPSSEYAIASVRGVAERLLGDPLPAAARSG